MQPHPIMMNTVYPLPPCYWIHGSEDPDRWLHYTLKHSNLASTLSNKVYKQHEYPEHPGGTEEQIRELQKAWLCNVYCDMMVWSTQAEHSLITGSYYNGEQISLASGYDIEKFAELRFSAAYTRDKHAYFGRAAGLGLSDCPSTQP